MCICKYGFVGNGRIKCVGKLIEKLNQEIRFSSVKELNVFAGETLLFCSQVFITRTFVNYNKSLF